MSRKECGTLNVKKNICPAQAMLLMEWWVESRSASMRGVMAIVNKISETERAHGKRYMGMWRLRSLQTVPMMSRLPSSVNRYMSRISRKMAGRSCCGKVEKPRTMNSDTTLWF